MAVQHKSKISVEVGLDENKVPEALNWSAEDGGVTDQSAKAMMLSVWDHNAQESLRIDLWTKDMPVDQMKVFFHQTLVSMSDTWLWESISIKKIRFHMTGQKNVALT